MPFPARLLAGARSQSDVFSMHSKVELLGRKWRRGFHSTPSVHITANGYPQRIQWHLQSIHIRIVIRKGGPVYERDSTRLCQQVV